MDKIFKILHKKLDQNLKKDKQINDRKKLFEDTLKEDKLEYVDNSAFSYYENEIIYRSIMNKRAIEDAYFQGLAKMNDFYSTLDFKEKQRMMNYEIHEQLQSLPHFVVDDTNIYIPFFDEKMNRIYQNEIVLFDLKQYREIVRNYQHLMVKHHYGIHVYDASFSSLVWVAQFKSQVALFDPHTKRLFFMDDFVMSEFVTLPVASEMSLLQELSTAYFYKEKETFITLLHDSHNIDDKLMKKLNKQIQRK